MSDEKATEEKTLDKIKRLVFEATDYTQKGKPRTKKEEPA